MAPSTRIKQRLLREAVQENTGQRPRVSRKTPQPQPSVFSRAVVQLLIICPMVIIAALFILTLSPIDVLSVNRLKIWASPLLKLELQPQASLSIISDITEETYPIPKPINFRVFPLPVKKIIIDPGHGGVDGGAVGSQGRLEKTITLDIAIRLRKLLEKHNFQVVMTRETDSTVPINKRVALANTEKADLFISIHTNWFKSPVTGGVETYYLGPTDDPHSIELAELENKGSGYTLGHFRQLLENVYVDVRRGESRQLAMSIQSQLSISLRKLNPNLINRGVKMAPFLVLVATRMPAVLAEVSFLSNQDEARLLSNPLYRQGIARALSKGIRRYDQTLRLTTQKGT